MEWLSLAMLIMKGVTMVEGLFEGYQKTGTVKKAVVTNTAKEVVDTMGVVSTGGQKQTWDQIAPAVDGLIELAVGLMNGTSRLITGKDVIDTSEDTTGAGSAKLG